MQISANPTAPGRSSARPSRARRYDLVLARSQQEIAEAQRLRFRVFSEELGAALNHAWQGRDRDPLDEVCDHLLVRDAATREVVGTYRLLTGEKARRCGGFYSEGEFELGDLARLGPRLCELGRACVAAGHRSGSVILMLWQGVARYAKAHGCDHIFGCASVDLRDGGLNAHRLAEHFAAQPVDSLFAGARPRRRLAPPPPRQPTKLERPVLPPLLKGYLNAGARVCPEPAWDPQFGTADFLVFLPLAGLEPRYERHCVSSQR
jgi:putative hemolysin